MKPLEIHRALISVSQKDGLIKFSKFLAERGVEILSTGGTAKALRQEEIPVKDVSQFTGMKEVMEGRLKTLHPKVLGGILAKRTPEHISSLEEIGGAPIDLIVVNFYQYEEVEKMKSPPLPELIEKIDIGGPSMVRAAAKNNDWVVVVTDPEDYDVVMTEIKEHGGVTAETRLRLAAKAFEFTARYDCPLCH